MSVSLPPPAWVGVPPSTNGRTTSSGMKRAKADSPDDIRFSATEKSLSSASIVGVADGTEFKTFNRVQLLRKPGKRPKEEQAGENTAATAVASSAIPQ